MYFETPDKVTVVEIPSGREGIIVTLRAMRDFARASRRSYHIRLLAEKIVNDADVQEKDWVGQARAIHAFVRDRITYMLDPDGVEMVRSPEKTLERLSGDCDDKATLVAALLLSIGHPVRLAAVGGTPGELTHVFAETKIGSRWFAVETTEPVDFGWAPEYVDRETVYI